MKILFISPEAVPFAKTGGLADVAGALPVALKKLGVDVRVVLPFYQTIRDRCTDISPLLHKMSVPLGTQSDRADVFETRMQENVPVYLVGHRAFYDRPGLYGDARGDYQDNLERFSFFCHASLCIANALSFSPDIVHCHDWQTGIVSALVKGPYRQGPLQNTISVFTVHNVGYQGIFPSEKFSVTGLSAANFFHIEGFEYWGRISLLKGGIIYSDAITTVSRKYAEEILTPEYGMGMEGVFMKRKDTLHGILNGVEYEYWNPATDRFIPSKYNHKDMNGKKTCKLDLVREAGLSYSLLNRPLLSMVTRLDSQKGIDLVIAAADKIVQMDTALVILGTGNQEFHKRLLQIAMRHPDRIRVRLDFNEFLAHRIIAASDIILIPSRYEPCGLTQMYALKYGTVPVVRATGGLDDTVSEFDIKTGQGNGFKFVPYRSDALVSAVKRACNLFSNTSTWRCIMQNGMKADFSWDRSVQKYMRLYRSLLSGQNP